MRYVANKYQLKDVCVDFIVPQRDKPKEFNGDIPWCRIEDIEGRYLNGSKSNQLVTRELANQMNMRLCPVGTVICACSASIGNQAITTVECYTNQTFIGIVVDSLRLKNDYLYWFLSSQKEELKRIGTGATIKYISKEKFANLFIPVPPLDVQERIVEELDCLSGVIAKKKEQLKELDALAQSIFYEMFGNPVENDRGWGTKRIGEICDVYRGGSPRPIEKFLGGKIPWIKIGDATQGDSIYLSKTKEHIIEEGLKKTRFIHSGSLIFANCGVSLGFARIITFDGCIHDGWLAFDNISNEIDKIFFLKSLNFCTSYFRSIAPDGVQPNLNTSIMKSFRQILPPIDIQISFVEKIKNIERQKQLISKSLFEVEMLFNSRMDYYFG